ncbi:MAG: hypothetical protein P1U86_13410 [Verrucomicrobiales bacterium]|nr:hypothetical protein [Verrucomicrobiales bacterium]
MKYHSLFLILFTASLLCPGSARSDSDDYTFFVRQIQLPDELEWDTTVPQEGSQRSELEINPNGARFELWAVKASPLTSYLLDTTYVNSYIPVAEVRITSDDPYTVIPRTRADRPFTVNITVTGLSSDPSAPEAAKSVKLLRHVQSYGDNGDGIDIDRGDATLLTQGSIDANGEYEFEYDVSSIPGSVRTEIRGEERFSVFSLADYEAEESQLDSLFVQVWPVAYTIITGLEDGDLIRGKTPDVKFRVKDLYPDSHTYAQIYEGPAVLGTVGTLISGSSFHYDSSTPRNKNIWARNWDDLIPEDGTYTIEVITVTPFGADRLAYRTFEVEKTISVNGNVTSIE